MKTLLFLALAYTAAVAQERDFSKGVVFCTYNIRNWVGADQAAPAEHQAKPKTDQEKQSVVAVIRDCAPDILGVCEMGSAAQFEDFRARMKAAGMPHEHFEFVDGGDPDRHVALVSRFPIVARNSQKDVRFELDGNQQQMKRGILDVTVEVTKDYRLRCVGVHLKSKLPTPAGEALIRRGEAQKLRAHLDGIFAAAPEANVICYGDFNDTKNEPMFAEVAGAKGSPGFMTDIWAADSLGDRWTHYWRYADQYARIDYLFASRGVWPEVQRQTARVYRSPYWSEASDHRPVFVTITPVEKK